jgi:hypothetical protein
VRFILTRFHGITDEVWCLKAIELKRLEGVFLKSWSAHQRINCAPSGGGDPIYVVGDEQTEPDVFGITTSTIENPDRNLYWLAEEEFEDISYKAIAMLCEGRDDFAEEIAKRAATGLGADRSLVNLGNVIFIVGYEPLKQALEKAYGKDWVSRYKEACRIRWSPCQFLLLKGHHKLRL